LWAVGHDRRGGKPIEEVYVDGFRHLLDALHADCDRFIYISSTGVYGQREGQWVDEDSRCEPTRAGGQACLAAERNLLASRWSQRAIILRLAGIYGPHRLPRLSELMAGQPLSTDPEGVINLIHVEDAARTVLVAAEASVPLPRVFVVADGQPVARGEFYATLARLAGAPPPRFDAAAASPRSRGQGGGHKRVSNRRMLCELGVAPRYPSYREGLAAVAEQDRTDAGRDHH
jgi:nucleoside-diphosphate-sugar epimerase